MVPGGGRQHANGSPGTSEQNSQVGTFAKVIERDKQGELQLLSSKYLEQSRLACVNGQPYLQPFRGLPR